MFDVGCRKNMCHALPMRFLKTIRESKGLSQYQMANFLGLRAQTYFYYEKKAQGINLVTLADIRERLGISWAELGRYIEEEIKQERSTKTKK
jgi:transcriptional regulator with XRE-family HTH domain